MAREYMKGEGLMFVTANQKIHKTGLNYLPIPPIISKLSPLLPSG